MTFGRRFFFFEQTNASCKEFALRMISWFILGLLWPSAWAQEDSSLECFRDDSVCVARLDLNDKCEALHIPYSSEYDQCLCEGGYLPLIKACNDCQRARGSPYVNDNVWSIVSEDCVSGSFSIAPLPASASTLFGIVSATTTEVPLSGSNTELPPLPTVTVPSDTFTLWRPAETFNITQDGMPSNLPTAAPSLPAPTDGPFAGGDSTDGAASLSVCLSFWVAGVAIAGAALADAFF